MRAIASEQQFATCMSQSFLSTSLWCFWSTHWNFWKINVDFVWINENWRVALWTEQIGSKGQINKCWLCFSQFNIYIYICQTCTKYCVAFQWPQLAICSQLYPLVFFATWIKSTFPLAVSNRYSDESNCMIPLIFVASLQYWNCKWWIIVLADLQYFCGLGNVNQTESKIV